MATIYCRAIQWFRRTWIIGKNKGHHPEKLIPAITKAEFERERKKTHGMSRNKKKDI